MILDKRAPLPLYFQLKAIIEERIDSGEWKPGQLVPSERELCTQFRVSRITVRQALTELVNAGRLVRDQGRGTFVAPPRVEQRLTRLTSFTQDMHARGHKPGTQILRFETIMSPPAVARILRLATTAEVILIKRLRLTDGEPMAVETAYLPFDKCRGLTAEILEGRSLYQTLTERFGIVPTRAEQQLEAVACPATEAKLLGIRKDSPVLFIHRTTFDRGGQPFEHVESYYRGDKYVFHAELAGDRI